MGEHGGTHFSCNWTCFFDQGIPQPSIEYSRDLSREGQGWGRGKHGRKPGICFGCKDDGHVYSRNGKITCPHARESDVKAKDRAKFKEIGDQPGKLTESQEHWRKKSPNLSDFSQKSLENIKRQVFNADADRSLLIRPRTTSVVMTIVVVYFMDQAVKEVVMIRVANAVTTILLPTPGMGLFFVWPRLRCIP